MPVKHPSLSNIIDISTGGRHTFVKTVDEQIFAFGRNGRFQMGDDYSTESQYKPVRVFKDKEYIWYSNIYKPSKAKSARK